MSHLHPLRVRSRLRGRPLLAVGHLAVPGRHVAVPTFLALVGAPDAGREGVQAAFLAVVTCQPLPVFIGHRSHLLARVGGVPCLRTTLQAGGMALRLLLGDECGIGGRGGPFQVVH